jgi:hypothetical protein
MWLRAGLVFERACGIVEAQEGAAGVQMSGSIEEEQRRARICGDAVALWKDAVSLSQMPIGKTVR